MRFEEILTQRQSLTNLLFNCLPSKAQQPLLNKQYKPAEDELVSTLGHIRNSNQTKQAAAYFLAAIYSTQNKNSLARIFYNQAISMDALNLLSTLALMELAIITGHVNNHDAIPLIERAAELGNLEAQYLLFNSSAPDYPPMPIPLTAQI